MSLHTATENVKLSVGIAVAATYRTSAEVAGVGVDMAKFNNYAGIVNIAGATQWQGNLVIVVAESTDNSTWSDTFLATSTVASATTNQCESLEVRAEQMTDGYRYLRTEVTPATGTGHLFASVNAQWNARFEPPA